MFKTGSYKGLHVKISIFFIDSIEIFILSFLLYFANLQNSFAGEIFMPSGVSFNESFESCDTDNSDLGSIYIESNSGDIKIIKKFSYYSDLKFYHGIGMGRKCKYKYFLFEKRGGEISNRIKDQEYKIARDKYEEIDEPNLSVSQPWKESCFLDVSWIDVNRNGIVDDPDVATLIFSQRSNVSTYYSDGLDPYNGQSIDECEFWNGRMPTIGVYSPKMIYIPGSDLASLVGLPVIVNGISENDLICSKGDKNSPGIAVFSYGFFYKNLKILFYSKKYPEVDVLKVGSGAVIPANYYQSLEIADEITDRLGDFLSNRGECK